jgi:peptidoglycan/LPS O-acetylase OafA/YrhL
MRAAGKYSYSAYVWHALVRYIVSRVYPAANPLLKVTIMTGVSFAIAAASYAVIERPFL